MRLAKTTWRRLATLGGILIVLGFLGLSVTTFYSLKPIPDSFRQVRAEVKAVQLLDRAGTPLNVTYRNHWNVHDGVALHNMPDFLKQAFVLSEDKRFYEHAGVDWLARMSAVQANLRNLRKVRGASTITEQVVRMLNPRRRTLWSRWLEGWEAGRLEARFSKDDLFEFYLNQVPLCRQSSGCKAGGPLLFWSRSRHS